MLLYNTKNTKKKEIKYHPTTVLYTTAEDQLPFTLYVQSILWNRAPMHNWKLSLSTRIDRKDEIEKKAKEKFQMSWP